MPRRLPDALRLIGLGLSLILVAMQNPMVAVFEHNVLALHAVNPALESSRILIAASCSHPADSQSSYLCGIRAERRGDLESADLAYALAAPGRPQLTAARRSTLHLATGYKLTEQGFWALAVREFRVAAEQDDRSGEAWARLGQALYRAGGSPSEATYALRRAVDVDQKPNLPDFLAFDVALAANDIDTAEYVLSRIEAVAPESPYTPVLHARLLIARGQPVDAAARLASTANSNADAAFWYGAALAAEGQHPLAVLSFERALAIGPSVPYRLVYLAVSCRAAGNLSCTRQALESALRLDANNTDATRLLAGLP